MRPSFSTCSVSTALAGVSCLDAFSLGPRLGPGFGQLDDARLDGARDDRLSSRAAATFAGLGRAEIALVGLDRASHRLGQRRPLGIDHGAADLVQPGPGRLVAAKAQLALELGRGDPALRRCHQEDRQKPAGKPGLGLLEDRAGEQRVLLAAVGALVDEPMLVGVATAAGAALAATSETIRPAHGQQVVPALLVTTEAGHERGHVCGQIGQHGTPHATNAGSMFLIYPRSSRSASVPARCGDV